MLRLIAAAPEIAPQVVISRVFGVEDAGYQPTLEWAEGFIKQHPGTVSGDAIGHLGLGGVFEYYRKVTGSAQIDGAMIPFCVEAWVEATHAEKGDDTDCSFYPLINRTSVLAYVDADADSNGLHLKGCGIDLDLPTPKRAHYDIQVALTTPFLRLMNDGKTPYLGDFRAAIEKAVKEAAGEAYRNLIRPPSEMTLVAAAYEVMTDAYMMASGDGALPAPARMIMYAGRGRILDLTGRDSFDDKSFTQHWLPDYIADHPEETKDWDVVYDGRGHMEEPHTRLRTALGTIEVRDYLGERAAKPGRLRLAVEGLWPTHGPVNRFRNILFCEKEGFDPIWRDAQLAERYDLAIMSTKGMSVVASRKLIDELAPLVDNIFVLHDFDVSGFSILGTLFTDSRRYRFKNDVEKKVIDIGLRRTQAEAMGLQSEPISEPTDPDKRAKKRATRRATLERHGASDADIDFLVPADADEPCRRIELNAMTAPQLVAFVEAALADAGVEKVVPDVAVMKDHARHQLRLKLAEARLAALADEIAAEVAAIALPDNLLTQVLDRLEDDPTLPWDEAVAQIVGAR